MDSKSTHIYKPTIFLVDDDELLLKSLTRIIEMRNFDVKSYRSAQMFLTDYSGEAGCLILDLSMPDMDGFELQSELSKLDHEIPIIFMTGHGGVPDSVKALRAGAIDFLQKPIPTTVLLASINEAIKQDHENRVTNSKKNEIKERISKLTDRERTVFDLLMQTEETPSSKELARTLDISHRTVERHRSRILEKLQVSSVVELRLTIDQD